MCAFPSQVKPLRPSIIGIRNDGNGLDPMHLQEVLSQWGLNGASGDDCNAPKLLYLIPNGGNPTGTNLTLARKREIYRIAQSYDLLILEDDPYFFLQFDHVRFCCFVHYSGNILVFDHHICNFNFVEVLWYSSTMSMVCVLCSILIVFTLSNFMFLSIEIKERVIEKLGVVLQLVGFFMQSKPFFLLILHLYQR